MSSTLLMGCAAVGLLSSIATASPEMTSTTGMPTLSVVQTWKLAGGGHWDYLSIDAAGKRLFVTRSDHVDVIDASSGELTGTILGMSGVHGVALAEDLNRGYASNGRGDSITAFDLNTLKVISEAHVPGHNPDAILYEPLFKHVFAFNGRSKDVTILKASDLAVIATLPLHEKPEFAVDDGAGQIYANLESEAGKIVVIDGNKLAIKATWSLPGCAGPSGLAIDKVHHRLFAVCDAGVMVVTDSISGKQVAKVKIGEAPDAAAFDASRGMVFSSNGEGTLTVIHQDSADRYSVVQNVKTKRGARTMAVNPVSGQVYLVTSEFGPAPPATAAEPEPHPTPIPGTLEVLVVAAH